PTGGQVLGAGVVRLIDGSLLRIPRIALYTTRGASMEKQGVTPDVLVPTHPDQLARGLDVQLDRAVEVLQADVLAGKKKDAARPRTASHSRMVPSALAEARRRPSGLNAT